jgi:hypothetical protein
MRGAKEIEFETGTIFGASFLLAKQDGCRRNTKIIFALAAITVFHSLNPCLDALAKAPRIKPEMVQEQLAARIACQSGDTGMRAAIATAGSDFSAYSRSINHFPRNDSELMESLRKLQALTEKNPYTKEKLLAPQISSQFGEGCAIGSITTDLTLTEASVRALQKFPPAEWQAYPGSICIVHNGADVFLVWAAGLDGKPLHSNINVGIALDSRQLVFH